MINLDTTTPLTFLEWKQYQTNADQLWPKSSEAAELSLQYNNYLIEWKDENQKGY